MRRTIAALAVIIGALLGMPAAATTETAGQLADGCSASPPQISVGVDKSTATAKLTVTCTLVSLSITIPVEITASGQNCELPVVEVKPGPTPAEIEFTGSFACEASVAGTATVAQLVTASAPLNQGALTLEVTTTSTLEAALRVATAAKLAFGLKLPETPTTPRFSGTDTVNAEAKVGNAVLTIAGSTVTTAEVEVDKHTATKLFRSQSRTKVA